MGRLLNNLANLILAIIYSFFSFLLFCILQILSVISPLLLGFFFYYLSEEYFSFEGGAHGYFVVGGLIGAFLVGSGTILVLKIGFSTDLYGFECRNKKLIDLVKSVSDNVGVSDFRCIYLTKEPKIETYYNSKGRYLIISILALKYLTKNELKTIIAHECAHHHNGAMLLNRVHYRTIKLFEGFSISLLKSFTKLESMSESKKFDFGPLVGATGMVMFIEFIYFYIFKFYLGVMNILLRESEYEHYCDAVAIRHYGGRTFSSALQKVFDILITENMIEAQNKDITYLDSFNRTYHALRIQNPPERIELAQIKSDTHPPLISRIERAQRKLGVYDFSTQILDESEILRLWKIVDISK